MWAWMIEITSSLLSTASLTLVFGVVLWAVGKTEVRIPRASVFGASAVLFCMFAIGFAATIALAVAGIIDVPREK
jgi:hypothetical protein